MNEEEKSSEEQGEELYEHYRFTAEPGLIVLRIDKYLMDRMPNTTRNRLQNAAKNGNILVNGEKVKSNYKVKPHDEISIVLPYPMLQLDLIPENIPIDIVYEDDDVAVVNKPSSMIVHPGYGNYSGTMVNALVYHFNNLPDKKDDFFGRPGLVHRLDKHTTGLMVIAKTEHALTHLAKQFFNRSTERRYWSLVWGDLEGEGTVTGNLGRSLKNRKLVTVFPDGDYGKHAVTHYKALRNYGLVTLVECRLETGRTHQIRAHMKHIGHTLFHDLEYGGDSVLKGMRNQKYSRFIDNCFNLIDGQALHAKTLGFEHPVTKEYMRFDSELPEGFAKILEKWETYTKET